MKKFVSLVLILFLLGTTALASSYSVYTWCEELPRNATFMFEYRLMSPVRTTQKPTKQHKVNYVLTNAFVAGFQKNELFVNSRSEGNVVPVTYEDGVYVYPIATGANTLVGLVWAIVEDGTATISMRLRDQVSSYRNEKFILRVYSAIDELEYNGMIYNFGESFIIEDNFYFEINGVVSYPEIIGSTKIGNCCAYYQLAEYNRYEYSWKTYRTYLVNLIN